jgi:hypothetical protein
LYESLLFTVSNGPFSDGLILLVMSFRARLNQPVPMPAIPVPLDEADRRAGIDPAMYANDINKPVVYPASAYGAPPVYVSHIVRLIAECYFHAIAAFFHVF